METTVLVKALRRVCLAQNSAAPDRRPARPGRPANSPGLRAILSDHRTILADLCAILPDPRAILSDLWTILSDPRAVLSDLCAILSDCWGILSDHPLPAPGHPDLSPKETLI